MESKVIDSRLAEDGDAIRRRRKCLRCDSRFTTYEKIEEHVLFVVKKDNNREPFERNKVITGIVTACKKRPISPTLIEDIVDDIEKEISIKKEGKEIRSVEIGEMIMEYLKDLDEVAYVRFASVYKEFKDAASFAEEIQKLEDKQLSFSRGFEQTSLPLGED